MKSLIAAEENAAVIGRIRALPPDARPSWGKLSLAGMLAHCQKPLLVAAGELRLKRGLIGLLFGRMAKKKYVTGPKPFPHDSPTDPHFVVPDAHDVEQERAALIALVQEFAGCGARTRDPHPFFGPMSSDDWGHLMWKHLDHHLRQFGG